jgi:hypothetical protein
MVRYNVNREKAFVKLCVATHTQDLEKLRNEAASGPSTELAASGGCGKPRLPRSLWRNVLSNIIRIFLVIA